MKTFLLSAIAMVFLFAKCNKDGKSCWQGWENTGNDTTGYLFCDITKAEAEDKYHLWFYRQGEAKFCWKSVQGGNTNYWRDMPESIKDRYVANGAGTFTKIDCNSFCNCGWKEQHKSKITGLYGPDKFPSDIFTAGDTCTKLFIGRIITVAETADSLITRELKSKR